MRVQLQAASNLNQTPAGRRQMVIEYAQAGIISQDEARRLMQHPDLESSMSLYTAALESVEQCLDEIADGKTVTPEPFMNLDMALWRGQRAYLVWRGNGAPEEILESLRQFVVQAAWMKSGAETPAANTNTTMPAPGEAPPLVADQMQSQPASAFAPTAMNLRAS